MSEEDQNGGISSRGLHIGGHRVQPLPSYSTKFPRRQTAAQIFIFCGIDQIAEGLHVNGLNPGSETRALGNLQAAQGRAQERVRNKTRAGR